MEDSERCGVVREVFGDFLFWMMDQRDDTAGRRMGQLALYSGGEKWWRGVRSQRHRADTLLSLEMINVSQKHSVVHHHP